MDLIFLDWIVGKQNVGQILDNLADLFGEPWAASLQPTHENLARVKAIRVRDTEH